MLQQLGEEHESSETLLLRFVNLQLRSAGSSRVADNWTTAMQDSEVFAVLLGQVAGVARDALDAALCIGDLTARAEALLQLAEGAGVRKFVTAQSIAGGRDKEKNVMFCANLFSRLVAGRGAAAAAAGVSVEQLQAQLADKERQHREELAKNESTMLGLGSRVEALLVEIAQLKQRVRELEAANAGLQEQLARSRLGSERLALDLAEQSAAFDGEREALQTAMAEAASKSGQQTTGLAEQLQKWQAEVKKEKLSAAGLGKSLKQSETKLAEATEELRLARARLAEEVGRHRADLQEMKQAVAGVAAQTAAAEAKVKTTAATVAENDSLSVIEPEEFAPLPPTGPKNSKARMQRRMTLGIRPDAQWAVGADEEDDSSGATGATAPDVDVPALLAELRRAGDEMTRLASLVQELRAENAQLRASSQDDLLQERLRREAEQRRMELRRMQEAEEAEERRRIELLRIKGILQEIQAEGYVFKKGRIMGSWKQV